MPNIVRARGIHVTDDVFKVRDVFPTKVREGNKLYQQEEEGDETRVVIMDVFDMAGAEMRDEPSDEGERDYSAPLSAELLEEAIRESEQIQQEARQTAEAEREMLLAEAVAEADRLKQEAIAQGHKEGYDTVVATIQQTVEQLEQTVATMEGQRAGFEAEYEQQLKWMALEIASKVLAKKVDENDGVLTDMVHRTLQGLKNESWVRVEVAQEMTRLIGNLQDIYDDQENIDVSAIPADPGTILIETASGVVDASLKTQLDNLKIYFQKSVNQ